MAQRRPSTNSAKPPAPAVQHKKAVPPFDIDNYLNPYVPRNPLRFLPPCVSYFFGHRSHPTQTHPCLAFQKLHFNRELTVGEWYTKYHVHTLFLYFGILVGAFAGVSIIENVFLALPQLSGHTVPIVIASFGAAAILEYNTIESPLAQPRNLILGHFFSALVGVSITKLFHLLPPDRFEDLRWLAGALSVGCASVLMSFSKTVHPPAGATALLAATNVEIQVLGWWLLPLVLLSAMLMLASALLVNNTLGRRFPVYWWTPIDLKALKAERRKARLAKQTAAKLEKDIEQAGDSDEADAEIDLRKELSAGQGHISRTVTYSSIDHIPRSGSPESSPELSSTPTFDVPSGEDKHGRKSIDAQLREGESLLVTPERIVVPEWMELSDWEDKVLRILMVRLREHGEDDSS
jgi:hypothetical protein